MGDISGSPRVGIVIVSHSALIAAGVIELARQMAPNVTIEVTGGADDGGLGTSFTAVTRALQRALAAVGVAVVDPAAVGVGSMVDPTAGVIVLSDLGSAGLTAETAREFLDERSRRRVVVVDAPLVEGAVAAAVAAEIGGTLDAVAAAAESARGMKAASESAVPANTASANPANPASTPVGSPAYARTVTLINRDGLHARPAADFVRLAATFSARVTVNGKDAKSLLGIMSLGLLRGARVELSAPADGAEPDGVASDAVEAVNALAQLIESGFREDSPL